MAAIITYGMKTKIVAFMELNRGGNAMNVMMKTSRMSLHKLLGRSINWLMLLTALAGFFKPWLWLLLLVEIVGIVVWFLVVISNKKNMEES